MCPLLSDRPDGSSSSEVLFLKGIRKSFREPDGGRLPILAIDDYHVEAGEQVVVVGRSGCGKTTLLHVIAGISRPDAGRVKVDGWDITVFTESECDKFRAERIGYVFQTFNLLPGFTALENVLLAMKFGRRRPDKARARHLLERVGLGHRMTHRPPMLSVGEQQRVAVARALANQPRLLLADEPTANVDSGNQQQIVDLLRETCREENVALVMVTHAPEVSGQFDRVDHLEQFNRAVVTR
ncbi:MAG: ABC transporter ATP-binding protein [Pirellulales bacterium]|nr:ABC transporter ATP-binding protein [Pirellulales bacterium]